MTPYEILNAPALVQKAVATGKVNKPAQNPDTSLLVIQKRLDYLRDWRRKSRDKFYKAGLTARGKPRKNKQHPGHPLSKDRAAYARFVRKTWTDAGLTTEGKPRKYRARKEKNL